MVKYSSKKKLSSNAIYNIVKSKYIYTTLNSYIKVRDIKTSKRLLDNLLILNCNRVYNSLTQSRYDIHTTLYFILIKYLSTPVLFNFSSINIILKYIITNNLTIPRLDLYIEGCNQIKNIFDTLIECIINNCYSSTKVINNCNIKFIEHSIDYIFINATNNINCNYNYYLSVILPIIENRNIYLEHKTINRLVYIILYYKKHVMTSRYTTSSLQLKYNQSNLNNIYNYPKLPNYHKLPNCPKLPISNKYIVSKLYNLVSRHIINKYTVALINKNSLTYDKECGCSSSRTNPRLITIKSNVDNTLNVLTDTVYNELNKIKQLLYSKSKNSWCNIYFKNFINYYTIRISDYTVSSTIIIDGRNYLYNTKKSDKHHKLNLNLLDKYIASTPTQYNNTFIVFNIKHKDIICNYLASNLLNKNLKFNIKPLFTNSRYNNYIRILIYTCNPSNPSNTIYILFTPLGVDDDLMTIYLKLSIPNAYLQTNDNYGKYFETIKSTNDYLYNLWIHINNINKSQYLSILKN
jgi:hypothetical protein